MHKGPNILAVIVVAEEDADEENIFSTWNGPLKISSVPPPSPPIDSNVHNKHNEGDFLLVIGNVITNMTVKKLKNELHIQKQKEKGK